MCCWLVNKEGTDQPAISIDSHEQTQRDLSLTLKQIGSTFWRIRFSRLFISERNKFGLEREEHTIPAWILCYKNEVWGVPNKSIVNIEAWFEIYSRKYWMISVSVYYRLTEFHICCWYTTCNINIAHFPIVNLWSIEEISIGCWADYVYRRIIRKWQGNVLYRPLEW